MVNFTGDRPPAPVISRSRLAAMWMNCYHDEKYIKWRSAARMKTGGGFGPR